MLVNLKRATTGGAPLIDMDEMETRVRPSRRRAVARERGRRVLSFVFAAHPAGAVGVIDARCRSLGITEQVGWLLYTS